MLEFPDLICRSVTVGGANARGQRGLPLVLSPGERKKERGKEKAKGKEPEKD